MVSRKAALACRFIEQDSTGDRGVERIDGALAVAISRLRNSYDRIGGTRLIDNIALPGAGGADSTERKH